MSFRRPVNGFVAAVITAIESWKIALGGKLLRERTYHAADRKLNISLDHVPIKCRRISRDDMKIHISIFARKAIDGWGNNCRHDWLRCSDTVAFGGIQKKVNVLHALSKVVEDRNAALAQRLSVALLHDTGKSLFARDCVVALGGLELPPKRLSAANFEH